jgi:hypothetical protein
LTIAGRTKLAESEVHWARAQRGFDAALGAAQSASLREAPGLIISETFVDVFQGVT